jgi:hypothetical protein
MHDIPAVSYYNEQDAQQYVANVREHMVEVTQKSKRMCTQKVVVAQILIACLVQDLQTVRILDHTLMVDKPWMHSLNLEFKWQSAEQQSSTLNYGKYAQCSEEALKVMHIIFFAHQTHSGGNHPCHLIAPLRVHIM